jgi:hypothetical protein
MNRRGVNLLAWAFSVAAHLMVFAALFWPHGAPPPAEPPPIAVNLVELPKLEPQPEPPGPAGPPGPPDAAQVKASAPQPVARPAPPPPPAPAPSPTSMLAEDSEPAPDTFSDVLSQSQLTGAASADEEGSGGGGGGGGCNTARVVQQALQRDPLVRVAVEDAHRLGKAVMLWNGDWVRSGDQDGKGLSAVREAIIWELAFTPEACRDKPMHGLVMLSLADGSTRFAIGAGDWRWSDLLGVRPSDR